MEGWSSSAVPRDGPPAWTPSSLREPPPHPEEQPVPVNVPDNTNPATTAAGAPVVDNQNSLTAGPRGPLLLQDVWFLEKLAHFDREVIPERRMHAKGSGAFGTFTVTNDITQYT